MDGAFKTDPVVQAETIFMHIYSRTACQHKKTKIKISYMNFDYALPILLCPDQTDCR